MKYLNNELDFKKSLCLTQEYPRWISRKDTIEIVDNKLGFVDEKSNIIYIAQIIAINKFNRRYKRKIWKEKENWGKNILFLSPFIGSIQLNNFKKYVNYNSDDGHFKYMQKIKCKKINDLLLISSN